MEPPPTKRAREFEIRVFLSTAPRARRVIVVRTDTDWLEFLAKVCAALAIDPEASLRVADDTLVIRRAGYDPGLLAAGGAYEVVVLSTDSSSGEDEEPAAEGMAAQGYAATSVRGRLSNAVSLDRTLQAEDGAVVAAAATSATALHEQPWKQSLIGIDSTRLPRALSGAADEVDPAACPLLDIGGTSPEERFSAAMPVTSPSEWQQVVEGRMPHLRFAPFTGRCNVRLGSEDALKLRTEDDEGDGAQEADRPCYGNFIAGGEEHHKRRQAHKAVDGSFVGMLGSTAELEPLETQRVSQQLVAQLKRDIAGAQRSQAAAIASEKKQHEVVASVRVHSVAAIWASLVVVGSLAKTRFISRADTKRLACVCVGANKAITQVGAWGLPRSEMLESCDEVRLKMGRVDKELQNSEAAAEAVRAAVQKVQVAMEMLAKTEAPHTLSYRLLLELRETGSILSTSSPIWTAVVSDDVPTLDSVVKIMRNYGHDITKLRDAQGCNLLFTAVAAAAVRTVRELTEAYGFGEPALLNATRQSDGASALWLAVERGHERCLSRMIACGADVNVVDTHEGRSAAFLAILNGNSQCLRQLIKAGADLNAMSHAGIAPLHYAVYYGMTDTVKLLLEAQGGQKQLDVELASHAGSTALDSARCLGHNDIIALLRQRIATQIGAGKAAWKQLRFHFQQGDIGVLK